MRLVIYFSWCSNTRSDSIQHTLELLLLCKSAMRLFHDRHDKGSELLHMMVMYSAAQHGYDVRPTFAIHFACTPGSRKEYYLA